MARMHATTQQYDLSTYVATACMYTVIDIDPDLHAFAHAVTM